MLVFRMFFNYDFLRGAPVYLASAPQGMFMGVMAMVFYVTVLAGMFVVIHFDLWPLTTQPAVMKQPVLGVVWLIVAIVLAAIAFQIGVVSMGTDPMMFLTRVTVPFIFGTIIVLNMLQNSLFAKMDAAGEGRGQRDRRRGHRSGAGRRRTARWRRRSRARCRPGRRDTSTRSGWRTRCSA